MDSEDVGRYWDGNAEAWTELVRAGYDVYRDGLNTPAFLAMLPEIDGHTGLDVGCGEGHNTRLLAERGACMTAVDISPRFIRQADGAKNDPSDIRYLTANAAKLPFENESFDFATAFMSFMDMKEIEDALAEVFRVLRSDGFLQFSITHPCFDTPHRKNLRNDSGWAYAVEVGDYFRNLDGEIQEWLFSSAPPELREEFDAFRTPRFTRTLSEWLNLLMEAGFVLERFSEPQPSNRTIQEWPELQDAQVVAYFLHVRATKPSH